MDKAIITLTVGSHIMLPESQPTILKVTIGELEVNVMSAELHFEANSFEDFLSLQIPMRYVRIIPEQPLKAVS